MDKEVRAIMGADWKSDEDSIIAGTEIFGTVTDEFGVNELAELAAAIVAEHNTYQAVRRIAVQAFRVHSMEYAFESDLSPDAQNSVWEGLHNERESLRKLIDALPESTIAALKACE